jgi:hypothetical protein
LTATATPAANARSGNGLPSSTLRYLSTSGVADPGADAAAPQAQCPGGSTIIGGGGGFENPHASGHIFSSLPTRTGQRYLFDWVSEVHNAGASQEAIINTAICLKSGRLSVEGLAAATSGVPPTDQERLSGSIDCDDGELLGFGLGWSGSGTDVTLDVLGPISYGDVNYLASNNSGEPRGLGTFHACSLFFDITRVIRRWEYIYPGETRALRARCPRGTKVTGGGSATPGLKLASRPYDGGDKGKAPDDGWAARTHYEGDLRTKHVVQAICLKV